MYLFIMALITFMSMIFFSVMGGVTGGLITFFHGAVLIIITFLSGYEMGKKLWKVENELKNVD